VDLLKIKGTSGFGASDRPGATVGAWLAKKRFIPPLSGGFTETGE
jgi:hypothetical protein